MHRAAEMPYAGVTTLVGRGVCVCTCVECVWCRDGVYVVEVGLNPSLDSRCKR